MRSAVFTYSYPNAKVRAMKGMLLSPEDFWALLNVGSYQQFLQRLSTTSYAAFFPSGESGDIALPEFSSIVYRSLFTDYEKTIHSVKGDTQKFFILLYQKYEVTNLKTILRGICSDVPTEQVAALLLPTERYTLFSKEKLLGLRKVQDVVEYLQETFFEYPLNKAMRRFEEEKEFFPIEMSLDLHYYRTLWESVEKLPGEEQAIVEELLGMVFDVLNISWIIRFKEQYHFSAEEILNYTLHHGYAFRLRDRRVLAQAPGAAEVLEHLKKTLYGQAISGNESLNALHVVLTRYVVNRLQKYFSCQPFQIGVILGYLLVKEYEAADLITIAEAKKYEFSLEQTKGYVVNAYV